MDEAPGTEQRDAEMQGGSDPWSQLPPELLPLIYKRLPDSADFVRFRAVCRAWRASAPASDPTPQLPWLLERRGSALHARQQFRFYSPSSGRTYNVHGQRGSRSWLRVGGAGHGYVPITVDLSTTALYNALTGERLALPTAPYPPWRHGVVHVVASEGGCLVVNTCAGTRHFGYCRPGQTNWNLVDGREDMGYHAYSGGRFFVNTAAGDTLVIDASTRAVESVVPPPPAETGARARADYLVESCGKLLRAVQVPREGNVAVSAEDYYFNIYQLDVRHGKPAWAKVESVGDRVLFFDEHGHGFSLAPNDSAGLRRDCVYFVHDRRTWVDAGEYRFLCRYSMEDGAVDRVVSLPDTFGDTWVVPSLCRSE